MRCAAVPGTAQRAASLNRSLLPENRFDPPLSLHKIHYRKLNLEKRRAPQTLFCALPRSPAPAPRANPPSLLPAKRRPRCPVREAAVWRPFPVSNPGKLFATAFRSGLQRPSLQRGPHSLSEPLRHPNRGQCSSRACGRLTEPLRLCYFSQVLFSGPADLLRCFSSCSAPE